MKNIHVDKIVGDRIQLRLLQQSDLELTMAWRNQEQIRKWFFYQKPISNDQHQAWYKKYQQSDNDFVFIIEEKKNSGKPIGQVSIYNINWQDKTGEFGRLMIGNEQYRAQGYAKEATKLIVDFAFSQLQLNMVFLEVFSDNFAAIAIYSSVGFQITSSNERITKMVMEK